MNCAVLLSWLPEPDAGDVPGMVTGEPHPEFIVDSGSVAGRERRYLAAEERVDSKRAEIHPVDIRIDQVHGLTCGTEAKPTLNRLHDERTNRKVEERVVSKSVHDR